jgi:hypothetical protein
LALAYSQLKAANGKGTLRFPNDSGFESLNFAMNVRIQQLLSSGGLAIRVDKKFLASLKKGETIPRSFERLTSFVR